MSRSRQASPIAITAFEPQLSAVCPETAHILQNAALTVHLRVTAITLYGSRGPASGFRPDIDRLAYALRPGGTHTFTVPLRTGTR